MPDAQEPLEAVSVPTMPASASAALAPLRGGLPTIARAGVAHGAPLMLGVDEVLALQRTAGNTRTAQLLRDHVPRPATRAPRRPDGSGAFYGDTYDIVGTWRANDTHQGWATRTLERWLMWRFRGAVAADRRAEFVAAASSHSRIVDSAPTPGQQYSITFPRSRIEAFVREVEGDRAADAADAREQAAGMPARRRSAARLTPPARSRRRARASTTEEPVPRPPKRRCPRGSPARTSARPLGSAPTR